jgi:hypothetical protein
MSALPPKADIVSARLHFFSIGAQATSDRVAAKLLRLRWLRPEWLRCWCLAIGLTWPRSPGNARAKRLRRVAAAGHVGDPRRLVAAWKAQHILSASLKSSKKLDRASGLMLNSTMPVMPRVSP